MTQTIAPAPIRRSVQVKVPPPAPSRFSRPAPVAGGSDTLINPTKSPAKDVVEPRVGGRWFDAAKTAANAIGARSSPGSRRCV